MQQCTKAIIPVAGYGSRRLPITKSIEKCMLPLGNRPVVDYIVSDCVAAGITDIFFVVSGSAEQLRDYYSRDVELEDYLKKSGKSSYLASITPPANVRFHYIEQDMSDGRYGTTVPVWLCRDYIDEDELFLVVMGDDVTYSRDQSDIERLVQLNTPAILGVPVAEGPLSSYGVIEQTDDGVFRRIIEKPAPGTEPSRMINVSKYVLPGSFMRYANDSITTGPNHSAGEYFIIDAINQLVAGGVDLRVLEAQGHYLDSGTVTHWIQANEWLLENYPDSL